jgi:ADP-heptose:LPS heptosyltransferase
LKPEKYLGIAFLKLLKISIPPQRYGLANLDHSDIKNILVILRHQMGDTLCALPMLMALREFYENAHITLVTKSSTNYLQIFRDKDPYVNEVKEFEYGFENFVYLIKELRDPRYDLAVVPSTVVFSVTNHLIAHYSQARYRIGVASFNGEENRSAFLLNIKSDFPWETGKVHQVQRNLDIIRQINIEAEDERIHIPLNAEEKDFARNFFNDNFTDSSAPIIGFHPGAGKLENVWNSLNFSELIYSLQKIYDPYFLISEGPQDGVYVRQLVSLLKEKISIERIRVHKGTLMNNLALINSLDLFVTNDTGIMHLAAGTDVPMVSLFGPSRANEWAPVGKNKISIQSSSRNVNDIKPGKVLEVCDSLLKKINAQKIS